MKSLIKNKQQKNTKQLFQKKTNTSRNRVHKKTNKFKIHKNIYYAQKGGSIETAKSYFIANYSKAIDAIRRSIYDDATLKQYITSNLQSIIEAKTQEIEALVKKHTKSMEDINTQIGKLTNNSKNNVSKNNVSKNNASKKQNIITKKQTKKQVNTTDFENKQAAIQAIIDKLRSGNIDTIYDDPELLFEYMIAYLTANDTNTKHIISENIDLFVKFYLNGTMGNPNSISNFGKLVDSVNDFKLLKAHYNFDRTINDFKGLTGDSLEYLQKYLEQEEYKKYLYIKKRTDVEADSDGQKGAEILINITNDNGSIIVYWLKTADAAAYYGKGTHWCTQSKGGFNLYNNIGKLYMIKIQKQKVNKEVQKYLLHVETKQFVDEAHSHVDIPDFIDNLYLIDLDKIFIIWFLNTYNLCQLSKDKTTLKIIINITPNFILKYIDNNILKSITFGNDFNKPLDDSLKRLTNLQSLTFGNDFEQPLGDSLNGLTNLQILTFGEEFNQPLDDSLKGLTNLQNLTFGNDFKQPLGDSLTGLTNLQSLTFETNFDQSLGNSLKGLKNLQSLTFGNDFRQLLGDSLKGLSNLQSLTFGYSFNQQLGDSLKGLTNLRSLTFGHKFSKPLDNSLNELPNLQSLTFGNDFNKPLGDSLNELKQLESLTFTGNFKHSLDNLKHLPKLKQLIINGKNNPLTP